MACDADADYLLLAADLTACIAMPGSGIEKLTSLVDHEPDVIKFMDRKTDLTIRVVWYHCSTHKE